MIMKVTYISKMDLDHKVGIEIMLDIKYDHDRNTLRYLTVAMKNL